MTCNHVAGRDNGDSTHCSTMTHSSGADLDSEMIHSLSAQTSSLALSSRPQSAAAGPPVRGSRPNSAAIAATIEGFENDFMVRIGPVLHSPAVLCRALQYGDCLARFHLILHLQQAAVDCGVGKTEPALGLGMPASDCTYCDAEKLPLL